MTRPLAKGDSSLRWSRALAHPLRGRIVRHLIKHDTATPTDLGRTLGAELGVVSYHVRRLIELDLVILDRTTKARGRTRHHYRLTDRAVAVDVLRSTEDGRLRRAIYDPPPDAIDIERLVRIGRAIARRRRQADIARPDLAAQVGLTDCELEAIERGEADPAATVLLRIETQLGTSAGELSTEAMGSAAPPTDETAPAS